MFCPNCGNNVPDNAAFCGQCGTAFAQASAPAYTAPAPAYAPATTYAQPGMSAKMRGLSKKEFLATEAAANVKAASKIALIVFVVIAILVVAATITGNNTSVTDLPIVKMVLPSDLEDELEEGMDEAADAMDDVDDWLDEIEEEYGSKALRYAKKAVNGMEDFIRKPSLSNTIALVDSFRALENYADEDVADYLDLGDVVNEMDVVVGVLKAVRFVTYAFAVLVSLLCLLAAIKKVTALPIVCIFLYVPSCALLSSVPLALALLVAFIVLAVFTSKVNKAWTAIAY